MIERRMPKRVDLGNHSNTVMSLVLMRKKMFDEGDVRNLHGYREILGFFLPAWQRGLVWSQAQQIALLESAWKGINIGTYTYNTAPIGHALDNLLIDGQQRMHALQCYFNDEFPVFGYKWSEVTEFDKRDFKNSVHFASYETRSEDEQYLRDYYNLTNFGGTQHEESMRA
jgi:uncharacterized protein with ParB-like and HNH nuclease domain